MTDDELLTRLRHDLDAFVGEPAAPPTHGTIAVTPLVPRRSAWLPVAAAAAIAALVVGGLTVRDRDEVVPSDTGTTPATTPGTTIAAPQAATPMPMPPTPEGWTVVEWGDVRLSLPPDLEPYGPGCTSEASDEITVVLTCGDRVLTIVSGGAGEPDPDLPVTMRNGLPTVLVPTPDLEETSSQLLIGETTSLVRFTRFGADDIAAIVDTVGVSSHWRVRLEPAPPVPEGWQTVELDGLSFRVPPNWGVSAVGSAEIDRDVCGFSGVMDRNVLIGRGSLDDATVDCISDQALVPAVDGVRVFPLDDTPGPLGNPFFEVAVESLGPPQVIRIGLGGDGSIGRTIVGSVATPGRVPTPAAPFVTTPVAPATTTPGTSVSTADAIQYEGTGSVFQDDTGTWLCVADQNYPTACTGRIDLAGWPGLSDQGGAPRHGIADWVAVDGTVDVETRTMEVISTRFVDPETARRFNGAFVPPDASTVCPAPEGGWVPGPADYTAIGPDLWTMIDGYAVHWWDSGLGVWNVRLTGDVDGAIATIRQFYAGPLCVTSTDYSADELDAIRQELVAAAGANMIGSEASTDARRSKVWMSVVTPMPDLQQQMDERYGVGLVQIEPLLVLAE